MRTFRPDSESLPPIRKCKCSEPVLAVIVKAALIDTAVVPTQFALAIPFVCKELAHVARFSFGEYSITLALIHVKVAFVNVTMVVFVFSVAVELVGFEMAFIQRAV